MQLSLALSKIPLVTAYFIAASLAVALTRYDGGVAFLWVASALLIADLWASPRSRWLYSIVPCAAAAGLATGWFGLGWAVAPHFMVINMVEASLAAWLFRRGGQQPNMLGSFNWLWRFVVAAGIVAPMAAAGLAAAVLWSIGKDPVSGYAQFFTGHALGNITFIPLALLAVRGERRRAFADSTSRKNAEAITLLLIVLGVALFVFAQHRQPLLFLPILPIILIAFRSGGGPTAIAIGLLAVVGGGATVAGHGPIQLIEGATGERLQFFQFYLAATVLTVLPVVADLQNRSRLYRHVRISEERYRLLADHSTDILMHLDLDGKIRFVSPSIAQLGGYDPSELIGRNANNFVAVEFLPQVRDGHRRTIMAAGRTHIFEYMAITRDGSTQWFETHSKGILDEHGEVESVLSIIRNVNQRKATEDRLRTEAQTDPLTGLANRRALDALIESRQAQIRMGAPNCLAVLDIDHFKRVNDKYGHDTGDEVLRTFARVAQRIVRQEDIVARIGGEEFALFFPNTTIDQAMAICDRLRAEMGATKTFVGEAAIRVTVSGGVARIGEGGFVQAYKVADEALYRAKNAGRDQLALAA